jgi:hypothetical protein
MLGSFRGEGRMILVGLLLAAGRCVDASFCPSQEELLQALNIDQNKAGWKANLALPADNSGSFTFIQMRPILRISDVYCGAPEDGPPRSIACKVTLHYRRLREFRIVTLTRESDGWVVGDSLGVFEERRAGR